MCFSLLSHLSRNTFQPIQSNPSIHFTPDYWTHLVLVRSSGNCRATYLRARRRPPVGQVQRARGAVPERHFRPGAAIVARRPRPGLERSGSAGRVVRRLRRRPALAQGAASHERSPAPQKMTRRERRCLLRSDYVLANYQNVIRCSADCWHCFVSRPDIGTSRTLT